MKQHVWGKKPVYDHNKHPLYPKNRKAARLLGWTFDPDFELYRDEFGHLIPIGAEPQPNTVDSMR